MNHKLKLSIRGQYKNGKGTTVFRYAITGSKDAVEAYQEAQDEGLQFTDESSGELIYLTSRFAGDNATLVVTDQGKIYVDMSKLEQQASLIAQLGGNLGQAMAEEVARQFLSGKSTPTSKPAVAQDEPAEEEADDEPTPLVPAKPARTPRK